MFLIVNADTGKPKELLTMRGEITNAIPRQVSSVVRA